MLKLDEEASSAPPEADSVDADFDGTGAGAPPPRAGNSSTESKATGGLEGASDGFLVC